MVKIVENSGKKFEVTFFTLHSQLSTSILTSTSLQNLFLDLIGS